jgi:LPS export ABC transporter protein LptC
MNPAMNRRILLATVGVALGGAILAGCKPASAPQAAKATPQGTPTPFPISVKGVGLSTTLFDARGRVVAEVRAAEALVGAEKGGAPSDPLGAVQTADATLYQDGAAASTLKSDTLKADRDSRVLTGTGNVTLRSLTQPDGSTIRADTMVWHSNANIVTGHGHVLLTRRDIQMRGTSFVADTRVRKVTLETGGAPTTGSF